MEIQITEKLKIDDGPYQGVITAVSYRDKPYNYTDVTIQFTFKERPVELTAGYATAVSQDSSLGKLLIRFKAELVPGQTIDPAKPLLGKHCLFQVVNKETPKGSFANVLPDSVCPDINT